jgi:DNA (cytosine-5)-methyltransferase 1
MSMENPPPYAPSSGSHRPRLLDLFCGAGGCSVGYHRAGFHVVGVDIEPHPDYPFPAKVGEAVEVLDRLLNGPAVGFSDYATQFRLTDFDAVHASPPCQGYTTMANRYRGCGGPTDDHQQLIDVVRDRLEEIGLPYVIENVTGARKHMRAPITLTGGMFGLRVERPRLFESNVPLTALPRRPVPRDEVLGIYGRSPDGPANGRRGACFPSFRVQRRRTEAIPPAYTEHIGAQLLDHIAQEVAA